MSSINRAQRGELITVGIALQIYNKKLTLPNKIAKKISSPLIL